MQTIKDFNQRLKMARCARGITQVQIAKRIGVTPNTYSRYETGLNEPNLLNLVRICDILGVKSDYLLTGEGEAPKATVHEYKA